MQEAGTHVYQPMYFDRVHVSTQTVALVVAAEHTLEGVANVVGGVLDVTDCLLARAFYLVGGAFSLQLAVARSVADTFLYVTAKLFGATLYFVSEAFAHVSSPLVRVA